MSIERLLEQECVQLGRFIQLLEREQEALTQANPAPLATIEQEKTAVVATLNALSAKRLAGIHPGAELNDKEIMQSWLQTQDINSAPSQHWQRLTDLARTAQRLNALNAQLVNQHLARTNQALSILDRSRTSAPLYGSDGQATHYTGSRIVDSA